ncbi:hypothetical protein ILUMI_23522 [Ignelater luminosus]|uniref:C2H2-type domain-containing protein n=1 Tax=Ignelater luminosus TaxID=2038154 RepID=A0A8K0G1T8_IGNLU|nr:hypothetical protein ILUMI_23522 [Ignelater luminosus]
MQLVPNSNCVLCDQNTAVLAHIDTYIQFVCDTFFKTNEHERNEFQNLASHKSICVLCAYKIALAFKFKSTYENKHKEHKKSRTSRTECSLCGLKSNEVVESDKNPNDFKVKIDSFVSCSPHPNPYKQWSVCFDCLFGLSVWFELRCNILKKLDNNLQVASTKKKAAQSVSSEKASSTINGTTRQRAGKSPVKMLPPRQSRRSFNIDVTFLKKNLKHLKSVEQVSRKLNYDDSVEDDKKMYKNIPYVLVVTDNKQQQKSPSRSSNSIKPKAKPKPKPKSKATKTKQSNNNSLNDSENSINERRSSRLNKPVEVIELSDTESEGKDRKENKKPIRVKPARTKSANTKTQKKNNVKSKPSKQAKKKQKSKLSLQRKSPFKIRLSSKFILPPETVEQRQTYTCSVCDKRFNVNCTYKVHKLWHEKPETIVVNVTRQDFSDNVKKQESDLNKPLKKKFRIISDININNSICNDSRVNGKQEESDVDVSTKHTDDAINNADSSENNEETMTVSSNKERGESQREDNVRLEVVEQTETPEMEEREVEKRQTEESSLEDKNSAVAENEHDANEKEAMEEESSQEVNAVHGKKINKTNNEENNEKEKINDKEEEVDNDSQKEVNGEEQEERNDSEEMGENKGENSQTGEVHEEKNNEEIEDNCANEITDNGKDVGNDSEEENNEQETEDNDDEGNESDNDYSGNKRDSIDDKVEIIEKQLAVIHGENNEQDEHENDDESNVQDEHENDETENDEPLSLKRKRVNNSDVSDTEENADNNEKVSPKTKRVRFATDFDMPNDEPLDLNISNNYSEEKTESLGRSWCSV